MLTFRVLSILRDNHIDFAGPYILQEPLEGWPVVLLPEKPPSSYLTVGGFRDAAKLSKRNF